MRTKLDSTIPLVRKGEMLLGLGLLPLVFALALTHFVMGIYLAAIPGLIAVLLLSTGLFCARNRVGGGTERGVGMLLLFAGFCVLVVIGFYASRLSYREAIVTLRPTLAPPTAGEWIRTILTWFLSTIFIGPGLAFWANWPLRRRLFWCIISFLIPGAVFITHQKLVGMGWAITS